MELGTPWLGEGRGYLVDWATPARTSSWCGMRVRYLRSMRETITVAAEPTVAPRADHQLWHARFLRLHYRMRRAGTE
jgi:hypothetical protein